jgi:hypothetical protein
MGRLWGVEIGNTNVETGRPVGSCATRLDERRWCLTGRGLEMIRGGVGMFFRGRADRACPCGYEGKSRFQLLDILVNRSTLTDLVKSKGGIDFESYLKHIKFEMLRIQQWNMIG